jgi:precorrin-2 dehydrogenase/sirohydrochlorin ferrochelatase
LLAHRGKITVVASEASSALKRLAEKGRIVLRKRSYRTSDLKGHRLVFVATDNEALNRRIAREAGRRGLLTNVADAPDLCDFIVPSIVRRGKLIVAVSTEGACPALSKRLRRPLERIFDRAYADYVELLARLRRKIISQAPDSQTAAQLLERLLDADLLNVVRSKGRRVAETRARELLAAWLGETPQGS